MEWQILCAWSSKGATAAAFQSRKQILQTVLFFPLAGREIPILKKKTPIFIFKILFSSRSEPKSRQQNHSYIEMGPSSSWHFLVASDGKTQPMAGAGASWGRVQDCQDCPVPETHRLDTALGVSLFDHWAALAPPHHPPHPPPHQSGPSIAPAS